MTVFRKSIGVMARRPFVLILPATVTLILGIINLYNPLSALNNLFIITDTSYFEAVVSFIKIFLETRIIFLGLTFVFGLLLFLSLIVSIFLSGYLFVFRNSFYGRKGYKGEFWEGVSKYYFRVFIVTAIIAISFLVLLFFLFVASVPATVVTKSWVAGEKQLLPVVIFVNAITLIVLSLVTLFYQVYAAFWYPAIYSSGKNGFKIAVRIAGKGFWKVTWRLIIFDFVLAASLYLNSHFKNFVTNMSNTNFLLILSSLLIGWIVKVYMFIFFFSMIFLLFDRLSERTK